MSTKSAGRQAFNKATSEGKSRETAKSEAKQAESKQVEREFNRDLNWLNKNS